MHEILSPEFFRTTWQQRPLHVPGGAAHIVDFDWTDDRFDELLTTARAQAPDDVRERAGEVEFVSNLDRFVPSARARAEKLVPVLGVWNVWFDSVRTHGVGSIGCHFDNSDNFVLQRSGTKIWRLWPAETVPATIRHRRMLGEPVGALEPSEAPFQEFVLAPGDLLYIPLMWPHWGTSTDDSLSLSLVANAMSAVDELLLLARSVLHARRTSLAVLPALAGDADGRAAALDAVRSAARTLAGWLATPEVLDAITDTWASQRPVGGGS